MLRQSNTRPYHWADKTMSVLRANQLEACEKDLSSLSFRCLFDAECTDAETESLYRFSYFPREDRNHSAPVLHTADDLRVRVLSSFAPELALLSPEEHDLLVRLVLFGGKLALHDWNDLLPARSLLRRLWCRIRPEEGILTLYMPKQLCASALLLLAGEEHKKIRDAVDLVHDLMDDSLYLMGMMHSSGPRLHLQSLLKDTYAANRPDLVDRMFLAGCDCIYDQAGRLMLIHPGLADPDRMLSQMPEASRSYQEMSDDSLNNASESVNELESPLYEQMLFSIMDAVRPEIAPEDAVEDLIILAKQGVPYKEMAEVLSSLVVSLPTAEMLKALRDLSDRIPRWIWFSALRVQ